MEVKNLTRTNSSLSRLNSSLGDLSSTISSLRLVKEEKNPIAQNVSGVPDDSQLETSVSGWSRISKSVKSAWGRLFN